MKTTLIFTILFIPLIYSMSPAWPDWDDSVYLALVYADSLQAPEEYAPMIAEHRDLIESTYSEVDGFWIFREWEPGYVYCKLSEAGWVDYLGGGYQELRDLIAAHPCFVSHADHFTRTLTILGFVPLHSPRLAAGFAPLDEVMYCYLESWCCDGPTIEVLELGPTSRYIYRQAWGDCLMGCIYAYYREFEVTDGVATLIAEWGDEVANEPMSWGAVKRAWQ